MEADQPARSIEWAKVPHFAASRRRRCPSAPGRPSRAGVRCARSPGRRRSGKRAEPTADPPSQALGPLHGVPVTTKVNVDQKGHPTDNGVVAYKTLIASEDSPVVANLKHAGAIVIGRSVRIPATCCGIVGLRSAFGRIPAFNPSAPNGRPMGGQLMSVQGPHTRSVRDARLALAVMARGDRRDWKWADMPLAPPRRGRCGWPWCLRCRAASLSALGSGRLQRRPHRARCAATPGSSSGRCWACRGWRCRRVATVR